MKKKINTSKRICVILACCAAIPAASYAQTFTTLVNFNESNGGFPYYAPLIQGADGNLYGTTNFGGVNFQNSGTIFSMSTGGALTTLHTFMGADGANPESALVQGKDGNFYGTTAMGGTIGLGTVFKITPQGALSVLHSFDGTDGFYPYAALLQAADGNLYGTTAMGGLNGQGTAFSITPGGTLTKLHDFTGADGTKPYGALIQGSDGNLYGTTYQGGGGIGAGTVFRMTTAGVVTTLHSFGATDGDIPIAGLIQAVDGNFYGTTFGGGLYGGGTVFKITPAGALTTVHNFGGSDGQQIYGGVVQATDGNFYGTTYSGGANDEGTIYRLTPQGVLTTLHSFNGSDGKSLFGGLFQASNGILYGTTTEGGANSAGTVFSLALGSQGSPGPSLTSGGIVPVYSSSTTIQPGEWVSIYGTNLASTTVTWNGNFPTSLGQTSVTINGKAAYLWFVSPLQINLQAPDDAATGTVAVVVSTAGGTASSTVTLASFAPSFCLLDAKHVTAIILRSNGSGAYGGGTYDIVGPTGTSLGYKTVAAKAGDSVVLFGVGFGPTNPAVPAGSPFSGEAPTSNPVKLLLNNVSVAPSFSGLSSAGLYQINLTVPVGLGVGDVPLQAMVGGVQTPSGVVMSLQ